MVSCFSFSPSFWLFKKCCSSSSCTWCSCRSSSSFSCSSSCCLFRLLWVCCSSSALRVSSSRCCCSVKLALLFSSRISRLYSDHACSFSWVLGLTPLLIISAVLSNSWYRAFWSVGLVSLIRLHARPAATREVFCLASSAGSCSLRAKASAIFSSNTLGCCKAVWALISRQRSRLRL